MPSSDNDDNNYILTLLLMFSPTMIDSIAILAADNFIVLPFGHSGSGQWCWLAG